MKTNSIQRIDTGNARLLYAIEEAGLASFQTTLSQVEEFVIRSEGLSFSHPGSFLYFFADPRNEDFDDHPIWVGKEIIGMPDLSHGPNLKLFDSDSGEVLRINIMAFENNWGEIVRCYQELENNALSRNLSLSSSWRIMLPGPDILETPNLSLMFLERFIA